jgi:phosphoglycolate phosphatase-like HAD superfamily hydrolase
VTAPKILALDFDGVICDTVQELLKSTWQVYRKIWGAGDDGPPPEVAAAYVRLRPALEIGWESPILLRAIVEGVPEADLLRAFQTTWRQRILEAHHLNQADLAARFDAARDAWIRTDLRGWLAANHLYPGIGERLRRFVASDVRVFVLTTKEGRFAHLLLEQNGVKLPSAHVWGKERSRPKVDLLRVLREGQDVALGDIWFVEDRVKTLQTITQVEDLEAVGLFLATWGYNTPAEWEEARADGRIVPLTLDQFCGELAAWPRTGGTVARGATR